MGIASPVMGRGRASKRCGWAAAAAAASAVVAVVAGQSTRAVPDEARPPTQLGGAGGQQVGDLLGVAPGGGTGLPAGWEAAGGWADSVQDQIPAAGAPAAPVKPRKPKKPARLVIWSMQQSPKDRSGQAPGKPYIEIANLGEEPFYLPGYTIEINGDGPGPVLRQSIKSGVRSATCPTELLPGQILRMQEGSTNCPLRIPLGEAGELILLDNEEKAIDRAAYKALGEGYTTRRLPDENPDAKGPGKFEAVMDDYDGDLIDTLEALGGFDVTLQLLRHFDIDNILEGRGSSDRGWYGKLVKRAMNYRDKYTMFAVPDSEWRALMADLAGPYAPALSVEELLEYEEPLVLEMLMYLTAPKRWGTNEILGEMVNQGGYGYASLDSSDRMGRKIVVNRNDKGEFMLDDDCVNKQASVDEYGCEQQRLWNKCGEAWLNDGGFYSGRDKGYCELSCGRCTCEGPEADCLIVTQRDLKANGGKDGILHVVNRLPRLPDFYQQPNGPLLPPDAAAVKGGADVPRTSSSSSSRDDDDDEPRCRGWWC